MPNSLNKNGISRKIGDIEERKKITEQKILQMKQNALKDIKNASVKISVEAVENLIKKFNLEINIIENFKIDNDNNEDKFYKKIYEDKLE